MRRHAAHEYTAVMSIRPRLIAWAEPRHEAMLRAIIADNACELIGISSARASDAAALAHTFNTESLPDLRQAVLSPDAEVIWLATPVTLDAALQRAIREHGLLVLTSEPMPALLTPPSAEPRDAEVATFVPAFVDGAGFAAAQDSLEVFGTCESLNLVFAGTPEQGSLFARLFDAILTVHTLLGRVEMVDAAMSIPRASVPEHLPALTGTMTLNLRVEGGRCASALVTSSAPRWRREALVIGRSGDVMRISEDSVSWLGEASPPSRVPAGPALSEFADPGSLIAERLMRLMQLPGESRSHSDGPQLLATCEAARLSAKVGFAEAPGTITHMMSRP